MLSKTEGNSTGGRIRGGSVHQKTRWQRAQDAAPWPGTRGTPGTWRWMLRRHWVLTSSSAGSRFPYGRFVLRERVPAGGE